MKSAAAGILALGAITIGEAQNGNATCNYPTDKVGSIHGACYRIFHAGADVDIAEKNCGDVRGDLSFVFPRGFATYYKQGYITKVNFAVTRWGRYKMCNHLPGKTTYSCGLGKYELAGREKVRLQAPPNFWTGGYWYSFPKHGQDKEWSSYNSTTGDCAPITIEAKCLFDLFAKAGHCPNGCEGKSMPMCIMCFATVMLNVKREQELWQQAIEGGACPRVTPPTAEPKDALPLDDSLPAWDKTVTWGFWRNSTFVEEMLSTSRDITKSKGSQEAAHSDSPFCASSPPQWCKKYCPPRACGADQCVMRKGSCCDLFCEDNKGTNASMIVV